MSLRVNRPLILILSSVFFFASCQKEVSFDNPVTNPGGGTGNNNNNIIGDWNFVGMIANTNSEVNVSSPLGQIKAVTVSSYVTKNNVGTIKITSSDFISTGVGYDIDTTMHVKTYMGGMLLDEMDMPFVVSSPPTSNTAPYIRINNDSLTTTGAIGVANPSGGTPTGPVGFRIAWAGDTLLLKVATSFTQNVSQGGVPGTLTASVNGIMKLKRR